MKRPRRRTRKASPSAAKRRQIRVSTALRRPNRVGFLFGGDTLVNKTASATDSQGESQCRDSGVKSGNLPHGPLCPHRNGYDALRPLSCRILRRRLCCFGIPAPDGFDGRHRHFRCDPHAVFGSVVFLQKPEYRLADLCFCCIRAGYARHVPVVGKPGILYS